MEFTGDPSVIFKSPYNQGFVSSYKGVCDFASLFTLYSQADSMLRAEINKRGLLAMTSDDVCSAASTVNIFTPSWGTRDNTYRFDLDVRSFSTAMAVNMGIIELSTLGWSRKAMSSITLHGISYQVNEYFDTRYKTMTPILCINKALSHAHLNSATNITNDDVCFLLHGEGIFLPIFNHVGASLEIPTECRCDDDTKNNDICNSFLLIPSLIFYKTDLATSTADKIISSTKQIKKLLELRRKYNDYVDLNQAGYNASASATIKYLGHNANGTLQSDWFAGAFDFCARQDENNNTEYCSLVTFASLNNENRRISLYQYELTAGHCVNSFSVLSQASW
jgi:hypothetical protein